MVASCQIVLCEAYAAAAAVTLSETRLLLLLLPPSPAAANAPEMSLYSRRARLGHCEA
jgi:hypothetical protein